jgi:hypothetical protein
MASRQKLVTLTYCFQVDAETAERDLEGVLSGGLSPYDFATLTIDASVEDIDDQTQADNVIWLHGRPEDIDPDVHVRAHIEAAEALGIDPWTGQPDGAA